MEIGRLFIVLGIVFLAAGLAMTFAGRLPLKLGHLPGDLFIQGKNSSFYFPLATCIVLSVIFSVILWLIRR